MGFMDWLFGGEESMLEQTPYQGQSGRAFQFPGREEWHEKLGKQGSEAGIGAWKAAGAQKNWRQQQQALAYQLAAAARGEGQSAAERQMMGGMQRAQSMAQSQAAGARGMAPGLAQYMAGQQAAGAAADITQQTGVLRAQEQAQAREQLAGLLGQARGQEAQLEGMRSGLEQQYMQMGMSMDQAQMQAQMQLEAMKQQAWQHARQLEAATWSKSEGVFGDILQAGGTIGGAIALSDKREKKNIKDLSSGQMDSFIESLKGYGFDYKKSSGPMTSSDDKKKRQFGIMAQDLQKSKLGKAAVSEVTNHIYPEEKPVKPKTEKRLMVDTRKLTMSLAAALGRVGERLDALEKKGK